MGGFLVSAEMQEEGNIIISIEATVDGVCKLLSPADHKTVKEYTMKAGDLIELDF